MKRFVSVMIVITLVISFCVQTAITAMIGDVAGEAAFTQMTPSQ